MINESGLKPLGRAVLVKPYEPERASSLIVMPDSVEANQLMLEQRVVVVEVGPNCWHNEPQPRAKVGDKVLYGKYSGTEVTINGEEYLIMRESDIFGILGK